MQCERCGKELESGSLVCRHCGAGHLPVCLHCQSPVPERASRCPSCGGKLGLGWNVSREEFFALGFRAFLPYQADHVYDIYLGGNPDGGGYIFHNAVGYVGPALETLALPGLIDGRPIYGVWNECFCSGDAFAPERFLESFQKMRPVRTIRVSNGIREIMTYGFFGCCGLETLILPKTIKKMHYDFYDLFAGGESPMVNGVRKTPVTIRYAGSVEDWERVSVTSRFWECVQRGHIFLQCEG